MKYAGPGQSLLQPLRPIFRSAETDVFNPFATAWPLRSLTSTMPCGFEGSPPLRRSKTTKVRSTGGDPSNPPGTGEVRLTSEKHTSELQSHLNLVCRPLL